METHEPKCGVHTFSTSYHHFDHIFNIIFFLWLTIIKIAPLASFFFPWLMIIKTTSLVLFSLSMVYNHFIHIFSIILFTWLMIINTTTLAFSLPLLIVFSTSSSVLLSSFRWLIVISINYTFSIIIFLSNGLWSSRLHPLCYFYSFHIVRNFTFPN